MSLPLCLTSCEKVFDEENQGFVQYFSNYPYYETPRARLIYLSDITGYHLEQTNGQRVFRKSSECNNFLISSDCEVYFSGLPGDLYEDELVLLFGTICRIFQIRMMMQYSGETRGFGYVSFFHKDCATRAVNLLNQFEIRPGIKMKVMKSYDNKRIYVGNIDVNLTESDITQCVSEALPGLVKVILYKNLSNENLNRGFMFLDFQTHSMAIAARKNIKSLLADKFDCDSAKVSWAFPENIESNEDMSKVKVLFIRGLNPSTSEKRVRTFIIGICGQANVKFVKKSHNYAFVHLKSRVIAEFVKTQLEGKMIDEAEIEVAFARPRPVDPVTLNLPIKDLGPNEVFQLPPNYLHNPRINWVYSHTYHFLLVCERNRPEKWKILYENSNGYSLHPPELPQSRSQHPFHSRFEIQTRQIIETLNNNNKQVNSFEDELELLCEVLKMKCQKNMSNL